MITDLNEILVEWSYRTSDGKPDVKNSAKLIILESVLNDFGWSREARAELLSTLMETDIVKNKDSGNIYTVQKHNPNTQNLVKKDASDAEVNKVTKKKVDKEKPKDSGADKTLKTFSSNTIPRMSLIEFILETGRTHQIRVHLAHKGNPLIGDKKYGKKKQKFKKINSKFEKILSSFDRQALHAKSLGFFHPVKKKFLDFDSKLPSDFKKILDFLDKFGK